MIETYRFRDCSKLWAHVSTVNCALQGCTVCCYRLIVSAPKELGGDTLRPRCRRNERPENCLRTCDSDVRSTTANTYFVDLALSNLQKDASEISILIVGDGNFSFSKSIVKQLSILSTNEAEIKHTHQIYRVTCSTLHSKDKLITIYPDVEQNIAEIETVARKHDSLQAEVLYQVDATALEKTLHPEAESPIQKFDVVIFNFPCVEVEEGQDGQTDEIQQNQQLLTSFLECSAAVLKSEGKVLITHKTKEPFCWWHLEQLPIKVCSTFPLSYLTHPLALDVWIGDDT